MMGTMQHPTLDPFVSGSNGRARPTTPHGTKRRYEAVPDRLVMAGLEPARPTPQASAAHCIPKGLAFLAYAKLTAQACQSSPLARPGLEPGFRTPTRTLQNRPRQPFVANIERHGLGTQPLPCLRATSSAEAHCGARNRTRSAAYAGPPIRLPPQFRERSRLSLGPISVSGQPSQGS